MLAGEIETTRVPRNPIDVLAQHIVAMCSLDAWPVDRLRDLVMRAYPFAGLGTRAFEGTLDMLDGRYPADDFAELRPRIVWDRINGTVRGRAGAQRLAVISGGTIPDRGLFTVNLLDDGRRVGELDEEMVYELRVGETFVLGATTWKTAEITQSQVRVVPAPGEPGKIAFWHGDALGRPVEDGLAIGSLTRRLLKMDRDRAVQTLIVDSRCDSRAADNLMAYLEEQAAQTGSVPDDRTIVVERFRDQLGDWRICVLSPWGARVHAPWALAVEARLRDRLGLEIQSIYSDDGFALRLVDSESQPDLDTLLLDPEDVRDEVTAQLHGSAMFASRFRENAARALLLPRLRPGSRTPLWLQRQRSADLLRVASKHPDFPVLAETYRECLTDVFDMDALVNLMREIQSRRIRVVDVETPAASAFASSLLFEYIAQYMYEGDYPLAERRAQALTLDRELLAELLGTEDLRELLDPEAIETTELELQNLTPTRAPRDIDAALDVFRRVGDLTLEEAQARGVSGQWFHELESSHRLAVIRVAGEERGIAAEDAARYRDALGISLPAGLPETYLQPWADPLGTLIARWALTHAPFVAEGPAVRWQVPVGLVRHTLEQQAASGDLLAGSFRWSAREPEYCAPDVLRTLRRRSLAALRREIEPVDAGTLARFLPAWQGVGIQARAIDRLADVIQQLQGAALPASVLERDVLPSRMSGYTPQLLDQLIASGEVVWVGQGPLGTNDGRVALYMRKDVRKLVPQPSTPKAGSDKVEKQLDPGVKEGLHDALRERLRRGACFFADLLAAAEWKNGEAVLDALWDLVWAGEVTNDTYAPLRYIGPSRRTTRRGHPTRIGPPRSLGRWSLVSDLLSPAVAPTTRLHGQTTSLLERYGIVTREPALAEGVPGGFVAIYPILRSMEESGQIRRGYFIEGLGGSQFAMPGAVDRLRSFREEDDSIVLLAATDPANSYGLALPWPELQGRAGRAAGAYVILDSGSLRVFVERGGKSLLTHGEVDVRHLDALRVIAARNGKLGVRTVDGVPVQESSIQEALLAVGFAPTHRGLVLYPERPALRSA
jgi:ATP-dependent Lhr-like helicase